MFGRNPYGGGYPQPHGGLAQSLSPIATVIALIGAFLVGPMLGDWTQGFVASVIASAYGTDWLGEAIFVWKGLCFLLVFTVFKAFALVGLTVIAIWTVARVPMLAGA